MCRCLQTRRPKEVQCCTPRSQRIRPDLSSMSPSKRFILEFVLIDVVHDAVFRMNWRQRGILK